jgi:hypothetical protein
MALCVQMRRRMATAIALSLPGGSKLGPYIHSMVASQSTIEGVLLNANRRQSSITASAKPTQRLHRRPKFSFLHSVPERFASLGGELEEAARGQVGLGRGEGTPGVGADARGGRPGVERSDLLLSLPVTAPNAEMQALQSHVSQLAVAAAAEAQGKPAAPVKPRQPLVPPAQPAAQPTCIVLASPSAPAVADARRVLNATATGHAEVASASMAEIEIRHIMSTLGPESLQASPVCRSLAGAFGRLQQSEHEAFLRLRAVRPCRRLRAQSRHCAHLWPRARRTPAPASAAAARRRGALHLWPQWRCVQADLLTRKRVIVEAVRHMPRMMPRTTGTGHALAPGYVPATMATMARAVSTLKAVWQRRNSLVAHALKQAHHLALRSMCDEVAARREVQQEERECARMRAARARRSMGRVRSRSTAARRSSAAQRGVWPGRPLSQSARTPPRHLHRRRGSRGTPGGVVRRHSCPPQAAGAQRARCVA